VSLHTLPRARVVRAIAAALATAAPGILLPCITHAQNVDLGLLGQRGFLIEGSSGGDRSGRSVSGAGDVNGDGLADLIVGAYGAGLGGATFVGAGYVVFGKATAAPVRFQNLGNGGFRISGVEAGDILGGSVSGAGDVNGDGLADIVVGASQADPGADREAGESYVVFGKPDTTSVALSALGAGGFRIAGIDFDDRSGGSVSGAGDVNGDGLADLIIGAAFAADLAGESYVVFGKSDSMPVDLANLGAGGFRIDGIGPGDNAGISVSGAGDVNGDGLADLVIGAHRVDAIGRNDAGESYVVFGKRGSTTVVLAALGDGGFRINGNNVNDFSGASVAGAGDVNGDGLADVIIGARLADPAGNTDAGESYVVFGKASSTPVNLAALEAGGFRIDGIEAGDRTGCAVSGAGDVNGDGLADLIIGAYGANGTTGDSYVVFGKDSSVPVNLAALGAGGFRIDGVDPGDRSGISVSGAGDVNGDGLADLIIGSPFADPGGGDIAGESHVVFSPSAAAPTGTYRAHNGNGNPPRLAVGTSRDGSNDDSPDARFWIDFADGTGTTGLASTETVRLSRNHGAFTRPAANVSWHLMTTRQNWTSAEVTLRYLDSELLVSAESQLQLYFSSDGNPPFVPLTSIVNPLDNTISANVVQSGFFYLGTNGLSCPQTVQSAGAPTTPRIWCRSGNPL
jgi:hypothetical protein